MPSNSKDLVFFNNVLPHEDNVGAPRRIRRHFLPDDADVSLTCDIVTGMRLTCIQLY